MRKKTSKSYFILAGILILLLSLPKNTAESARSLFIAISSPFLEQAWVIKNFFLSTGEAASSSYDNNDGEIMPASWHLQKENWNLKNENEALKQLAMHAFSSSFPANNIEMCNASEKNGNIAIPAKVIFRPPSTWYSVLWVNVGDEENNKHQQTIIAKNSPVIIGNNVVGVVDWVGKYQSRIRLITDSELKPSVRVLREGEEDWKLAQDLSQALAAIKSRKDLFENADEYTVLTKNLEIVQKKIIAKNTASTQLYLAKGELHGSASPMWRKSGHVLKGIGFNYDFADEYGPARDLRTGKPQGTSKPSTLRQQTAIPLVKVNDLLVTTGMDGVFPANLRVATVTHITPLKEGDYVYELEAIPCIDNLDTLSTVFIIPPL